MADGAFAGTSLRTETVLRYLADVEAARCITCGTDVCGHEALMCLVMGFKTHPRCLNCLTAALARERREFRDHVYAYIAHHECLRAGWDQASRAEGVDPRCPPGCLWAAGEGSAPVTDDAERQEPETSRSPMADAEWDAGDMGCGDLVMELRMRLHPMRPGEILKITARDPGAPEDLPAWCRLTGHTLVSSQHPDYWIERREG